MPSKSLLCNKMKNSDSKISTAKSYLYIGTMFFSGGCLFIAVGIHLILNPEIPISCNGELSYSLSCKRVFIEAGVVILLIGVGLLVARYRLLRKSP